MEGIAGAEAALKRIPFFVRKRVRTQVEKKARDVGVIGACTPVLNDLAHCFCSLAI